MLSRNSAGRTLAIRIAGLATGLAMLGLTPGVAFADGGPGGEFVDSGVLPLTPQQASARDAKLALADALSKGKGGKAPKSGPTPYLIPPPDGGGGSFPDSVVLTDVKPRHQYRMWYCGPATIQVLSNLSWGIVSTSTSGQATSTNKYTQTYISTTWAHASSSSGTSIGNLIDGLNGASQLPYAGFYSQWQDPTWSQFHTSIMTDTYGYGVGLAAGVNPRKLGSIYYLTSWKNNTPKDSIGHYIPIRGYSGNSQATADVYYSDSSGGADEVDGTLIAGSTGNFKDPSYTVYKTMMNRYGNLAW
jgi:hypothetical protein